MRKTSERGIETKSTRVPREGKLWFGRVFQDTISEFLLSIEQQLQRRPFLSRERPSGGICGQSMQHDDSIFEGRLTKLRAEPALNHPI